MKRFNPLRLLTMAYLQSIPDHSFSRYEVMTNINLLFKRINTPYSPGAFYHEIQKLKSENMININQESISISAIGMSWLKEQMSVAPLPGSIVGKIYFLSAAALLCDQEDRRLALKRMEIDMINNNHIEPASDQKKRAIDSVTNFWLSQLSSAIKRTILDLGAL